LIFAKGIAQRLCPFFLGHLVTLGFLITHKDVPQSVRHLLDELPARHRDLYLITHNTHNRQTSMPPVGFKPMIAAGEWLYTYDLDHAATETGLTLHMSSEISLKLPPSESKTFTISLILPFLITFFVKYFLN
jgi:hypothetical protein